jgi:phosphate/sulfate permease
VLLLLTRAGIPVSTTFLLLSCFATEVSSVVSIVTKSFIGYGVAFACAAGVWLLVSKTLRRFEDRGPAHAAWSVAQWITTGLLWMTWLMQDAANVAVYLPRSLGVLELGAFLAVIFLGLGLLFKLGGERVQKVVDEKSRVVDVRAATVVDLVYALILYVFKTYSTVPMSTTWVFVGLLAGREIAMAFQRTNEGGFKQAFRLAGKDLLYVSIGLVVSTALAFASNEAFMADFLGE